MGTFSVIIPSYNRAHTIGRTLESVLKQDCSDWEVVVVDDGSTDATEKIVEPFLADSRIRYFPRENAGVGAARNFGVSQCTGEILVFLDSDDEAKPGWLADFKKMIDSESACGYLSCGYLFLNQEYRPKGGRGFAQQPYLCAPAGAFAMPKSVFEAVGGYDTSLRQSENWELAARALTYCKEESLKVLFTNNCNIIWHGEKTKGQLRQRDYDRAKAYLYLHKKYADGGILQFRSHRFLLGAAVGFVRAGQLSEARKWFYRSFWRYPSLKALARIICFEIPPLRRKIWMSREFLYELTDD